MQLNKKKVTRNFKIRNRLFSEYSTVGLHDLKKIKEILCYIF